jgi:hypothetical protein
MVAVGSWYSSRGSSRRCKRSLLRSLGGLVEVNKLMIYVTIVAALCCEIYADSVGRFVINWSVLNCLYCCHKHRVVKLDKTTLLPAP